MPRVIQIEHGRDGVYAQSVDVKFLQPVERVGKKKRFDLVAAVIERHGAPLAVFALARIGMFVESRAVEAIQRVRVAREMAWHPIEHDADAGLMTAVHEIPEIVGRSEA